MSKDEKRELYACGSKYVTLEEVDTWQKRMAERSVRCKYPSGNHRTFTSFLRGHYVIVILEIRSLIIVSFIVNFSFSLSFNISLSSSEVNALLLLLLKDLYSALGCIKHESEHCDGAEPS